MRSKAASAASVHRVDIGPGGNYYSWSRADTIDRPSGYQLLARFSQWAYRCITTNAQVFASVPFKLYSTKQATRFRSFSGPWRAPAQRVKGYLSGRDVVQPSPQLRLKIANSPDDLTEIVKHPLLDFLSDVNEYCDGYSWREQLAIDLQVFGRHFSVIAGDELWRLRTERVKVKPDERNWVQTIRYGEGDRAVDYKPEDLLWIKLPDPFDPWGGYGPLEAWLRVVDTQRLMTETQHWNMLKHGAPDYVVIEDVQRDEKQKTAFLSGWRSLFGRSYRRSESVAFLGGNPRPELQRLNDTPKEMEFKDSQAQMRDMIGQAFGVPGSMLAQNDVGARATAREAGEQYISNTIWPYVQRVEAAINEQLVPRFGEKLVLIFENPLPEDRALRLEERAGMLATGATPNEVRIMDGQEPLTEEGMDDPWIASTVQPIDKVMNPPLPMLGLPGDEPNPQDANGEQADEPEAPQEPDAAAASAEKAFLLLPRPPARIISQASLWTKLYAGTLNGELHCGCRHKDKGKDDPKVPRGFEGQLRSYFRRQANAMVEALEAGGAAGAGQVAVDPKWVDELSEQLMPLIQNALGQGLRHGANALPSMIGFDVTNPEVTRFTEGYTIKLARQIAGTTELAARDVILSATGEGLSIPEISKRLMDMDAAVSSARAEMIARTETTRAFMEGQREAWAMSGQVVAKRWLLAPGACEFCQAVSEQFNAKEVPLNDAFFKLGDVLEGKSGGKMRLDYSPIMGPPLHPHDRCDLVPVLR